MPFSLKNVCVTYQRLMDVFIAQQIGINLEVYVDDMIVKTIKWLIQERYLDDLL